MKNISNWYDNELCEICKVQPVELNDSLFTVDVFWVYTTPTHCQDLRRNREAREHKNIKPKVTVF